MVDVIRWCAGAQIYLLLWKLVEIFRKEMSVLLFVFVFSHVTVIPWELSYAVTDSSKFSWCTVSHLMVIAAV